MLVTKKGNAIRIKTSDIRPIGKTATGVKAIKLNAITNVDSSSDPVADALAKIQAQLPSGVNAAWKNPAPGTITAIAADYDVVLTKGTQSVETKVSIKTA